MRPGLDLAWLVEALEPAVADRVLDLGCGAGHAGFAVAAAGARRDRGGYLGTDAGDSSPPARKRAQGLSAYDGRSRPTSAPSRSRISTFDGVVSRYSAHHWPDIAAALGRGGPGAPSAAAGCVIIDTVAPDDPALDTLVNALELLRDPTHGRNLRLDEWRAALTAAGLEVAGERRWPIVIETVSWFARGADGGLARRAQPGRSADRDLRRGRGAGHRGRCDLEPAGTR